MGLPYCLLLFTKKIILKEQLVARCLFRCSPETENCWATLAWIIDGLSAIRRVIAICSHQARVVGKYCLTIAAALMKNLSDLFRFFFRQKESRFPS